ncbi:MAG: hypothetical protein IPN92_04120 [Chromatiaceae bacterium]|nr:hypothetical protein [Chromatiaceae bacterium]
MHTAAPEADASVGCASRPQARRFDQFSRAGFEGLGVRFVWWADRLGGWRYSVPWVRLLDVAGAGTGADIEDDGRGGEMLKVTGYFVLYYLPFPDYRLNRQWQDTVHRQSWVFGNIKQYFRPP